MSQVDNIEPNFGNPDPDPDWDKDSLAVIASDGDGGWVMFCVGAHLDTEIDNIGTRDAEELGILPPGAGIWIWSGKYVGGGVRSLEGDYSDPELKGTRRAPTDTEWIAIRAGQCPWDPDEWLLKSGQCCSRDFDADGNCDRHPALKTLASEIVTIASNRRPSLAQRRAALGLSSLSASERRENLAEILDDLTKG